MEESKFKCNCHATGGGIYGLAFIGALIYYIQNSAGFSEIVWGIFKALLWPAFLVYELLQFLAR